MSCCNLRDHREVRSYLEARFEHHGALISLLRPALHFTSPLLSATTLVLANLLTHLVLTSSVPLLRTAAAFLALSAALPFLAAKVIPSGNSGAPASTSSGKSGTSTSTSTSSGNSGGVAVRVREAVLGSPLGTVARKGGDPLARSVEEDTAEVAAAAAAVVVFVTGAWRCLAAATCGRGYAKEKKADEGEEKKADEGEEKKGRQASVGSVVGRVVFALALWWLGGKVCGCALVFAAVNVALAWPMAVHAGVVEKIEDKVRPVWRIVKEKASPVTKFIADKVGCRAYDAKDDAKKDN